MTGTSGESLLKLVYTTGGMRADPASKNALDRLVADGFLFLENGPAPSAESPPPEPIYRLTAEGKKFVESLFDK
jgi:DNA-binding PadR family transcriptional regulator